MIDDLESLLSDVDKTTTSKGQDNESLRFHEQAMRKGDRLVVDLSDEDVERRFLSRIDRLRRDKGLDPFRVDYSNAIEQHIKLASQFRETLSENIISESVSTLLKKFRYTLERAIENVEKSANDYISGCSPSGLHKKAKQDFHHFFASQEMTDNRLNFMIIKEVFTRTRELNSRLKKEWEELLKAISVANMSPEGKATYVLCSTIISEAQLFCDKTDSFVTFLAAMLAIPENETDILEKEIAGKTLFFESYDYDCKRELTIQKTDGIDDGYLDIPNEIRKIEPLKQRKHDEVADKVSHEEISSRETVDEFPIVSIPFTIKGTASWNTKEPYILKVDNAKLIKDYNDLERSIYFNNDIPDPVKVNGLVKRAMILFLRNPEQHIMNEYGEFIFKTISLKMNDLINYFGLPDKNSRLFIYHLGPFTIHKMLVEEFNSTGLGICFKLLPDNKVSRFAPNEFIKEKVLLWFESNINLLELEFDRVSDFNEIKRLINDKYLAEKSRNEDKISKAADQYLAKTGKVIDESALIRKKAAELFGENQIAVYNRFIDRTIFK
jgi:hypothetical protein